MNDFSHDELEITELPEREEMIGLSVTLPGLGAILGFLGANTDVDVDL